MYIKKNNNTTPTTNSSNKTTKTNNTTKANNKEVKTMGNTIKENREREAQEKKEAARQKFLASIEPKDYVSTMEEVINNTARLDKNASGETTGLNGGRLYQETLDGRTTIAANSPEELQALKENIANGLQGDGKFHKIVFIKGVRCDCVGNTPEEVEADIAAAEEYMAAHGEDLFKHLEVAGQLVDAGYDQKDLEQIDKNAILCYSDGGYVMDTKGNTIANLEDIHSKLSKEDMKTILTERAKASRTTR